MATTTQEKGGLPLTSDEIKALVNLLKHPKVQSQIKEVEDAEKKNK